jgi:hypothetical protein
MNIITHVLKKDVIRLKFLMLVWLLLIIVQLALGVFSPKLAAEAFELQLLMPLLMRLIGFLQGLMMVIVIPLIIQDDSVVGSTAFWYTRPILRKELLLSKSLAMLTVLVLPLLAAELFVLAANGASGYHLALAIPEVVLEKLAFIIPFVILAAVTPKLSRYALVGVIVFAIIVVIMILMFVAGLIFPAIKQLANSKIYETASLEASYTVADHLCTIIIGSLLICYQFMTRRTVRTAMMLVAALIVMWAGTLFWNFDFLKESAAVESSAIKVEGVSLGFDSQHMMVSDQLQYNKNNPREKSISTKSTISGLPKGQFTILEGMDDAKMEYPDGSVLESEYISTMKRQGYYSEKFMAPIQEALGDVKLVNPFNEKFSYTEVFSLRGTDLHKHKDKVGTYSARANLDIYKYNIVSKVPLGDGMKGAFGAEQVVIYDVLERDNAVSVILHEKKINLLFDRRIKKVSRVDLSRNMYSEYSHVYLLVNKERQEAFLPEPTMSNIQVNAMDALGPRRVNTKTKVLDFMDVNSRNSDLPKMDKEWLAGAELVRMNAVLTGTAEVDFKVEDFSLPSESTSQAGELDELDQQLKSQDKRMQQWKPD